MKNRLITWIMIIMMVTGILLILYPTASNYMSSVRYHKTITDYKATMEQMDNASNEEVLTEAYKYNEWIASRGTYMRDLKSEELDNYYRVLDPFGSGIMGYVAIPSISVSLPIYHGTSDAVLQAGVGHITGTSLPVGGNGTHCIISGHRGMVSSKLFTDLDKLKEGDRFILCVMDERLVYQVDRIKTILPSELGRETIDRDEDWCTLLTCTPYGVNSHRLLVRGTRVFMDDDEIEALENEVSVYEGNLTIPILIVMVLILTIIIMLYIRRRSDPK